MARQLNQGGDSFPLPDRPGKYDRWLTGAVFELNQQDGRWFLDWMRLGRAIRGRARSRGFRAITVLSDDRSVMTVQALELKRWQRFTGRAND